MSLEYEFYLDLFFLTDFFLNLLSLFLSASMGRMRGRPARLILAAAAGSLWSCSLILFPIFPLLFELALTVAFMGSFMTAFSFSLKSPAEIVRADLFLTASVLLTGGCLVFLKEYLWLSDWEGMAVLTASCLGAGLFFRNAMKERERGKERFQVWLYYRGQKREFLALADSGNRLREPVSGKPVSVISYESCKGFCDVIPSVLYIPYRSVGTREGMLPGIIFEKMEIYREGRLFVIERPIVAVTKEPLSGSEDFSMLLPEEFVV